VIPELRRSRGALELDVAGKNASEIQNIMEQRLGRARLLI